MSALVVSRCRRRGVRRRAVERDGGVLLARLAPGAELSVALIDDIEMRELNRNYRGKDQATDVLAFPMNEEDGGETLLGDVVISLDTAIRQARNRGVDPASEVRVLLVHGLLHLLGYDHEVSPAEARRMFRKQRAMVLELEGFDTE